MSTILWILGVLAFVGLLIVWPGFRAVVGQIVYAVLEQLRYFW